MVRESLAEILAGTYQTPSLEDMISVLARDFDHPFDEFRGQLSGLEGSISLDLDERHNRWEVGMLENMALKMQKYGNFWMG
jgi:hypothetical protein